MVEPREFAGRLLHNRGPIPAPQGDVYIELYLGEPENQGHISLYRSETRIFEDMQEEGKLESSGSEIAVFTASATPRPY